MAKTTHALNPGRAKVEIGITTEMVAAFAGLTTVETIDISSIVTNIGGSLGVVREVADQYVVGDDTPIIDISTKIPRSDLTIEFLWTDGKDTLGTDLLDIYTDVLLPLSKYTDAALPLPVTYSLSGGDVGDNEVITSTTETFLTNLPAPVGGVDTGGLVTVTATLTVSDYAMATVV